MNKLSRPLIALLLFAGIISLVILALQPVAIYHYRDFIALLFPKGIIALKERNLLFLLQAIMLIVVVPVYILTFIFAWKYRAGNKKAKYDPDLVDHKIAEYFWWGIPAIITIAICAITWVKTYELDPYRPIASDKKEKVIQVVALQWKWLFLYPEEKIASVNFLQIPKGVPIRFEITADSPMNSFWIPHLGGQIYAMPNMKSVLYLVADEEGDFRGSSANISGEGFANMHFITRASSEEDYENWVSSMRQSGLSLDWEEYERISLPSQDQSVASYTLQDDGLFNAIAMRYMHPKSEK
jgi:cytochrome o ubiquinol oxidase subunit 2